jgi:hypothetical protein
MSPVKRVDVDDRLGEGLRGLLGQVVPDAALDRPVLVLARELAGEMWATSADLLI